MNQNFHMLINCYLQANFSSPFLTQLFIYEDHKSKCLIFAVFSQWFITPTLHCVFLIKNHDIISYYIKLNPISAGYNNVCTSFSRSFVSIHHTLTNLLSSLVLTEYRTLCAQNTSSNSGKLNLSNFYKNLSESLRNSTL